MTSQNELNIFITGATGYIGGSVLDRLLDHPRASSFRITALVRSEAKAKNLSSLGVETVVGSYADLDLLEEQASKADYVLAIADCDDEKANSAILKGLKTHFEKTGKAPVLIHTSGVAFLIDDAFGSRASDKIWRDTDAASIEAIPVEKIHRPVDTAIVQAAKNGYAKTHIIIPGLVYGAPSGRVVDLGVQQTNTIAVKMMVQAAAASGSVLIPGEGKNVWASIHVDDCADLFYVIFNNNLEGKEYGSGAEGYYFAETGEYTLSEVIPLVAAEFHKRGRLASPTPTVATGEATNSFFLKLLGGNTRCRGDRGRAAGWKPVVGDAKFKAELQKHIEAALDEL